MQESQAKGFPHPTLYTAYRTRCTCFLQGAHGLHLTPRISCAPHRTPLCAPHRTPLCASQVRDELIDLLVRLVRDVPKMKLVLTSRVALDFMDLNFALEKQGSSHVLLVRCSARAACSHAVPYFP